METSKSGTRILESHYAHIRPSRNSPKIVNDRTFKENLEKIRGLAFTCSIPSRMCLEIWKKSDLKTRILYLCLPLSYLIPAFDILRFIWFIVDSYLSNNNEYILGKSYILMTRIFSAILPLIAIRKRSNFNTLIDDLQKYNPKCQTKKLSDICQKIGSRSILITACMKALLAATFQIILPLTLIDPEYFMEVLGFPLSRQNNFFTFMLIMNFSTDIWNSMLFLPFEKISDVLTPIFIEEFKYLSDALKKSIKEIQVDEVQILRRRKYLNELLTEIINQHDRLSRLSKKANSVFQNCNGIIVSFLLIICCMVSYEIANKLIYQSGYILQVFAGIATALYISYLIHKGVEYNSSVSISFLYLL